jgi:hypothetical protein
MIRMVEGDIVVEDHGGGNHFHCDFVVCVDVLQKESVSDGDRCQFSVKV